MIPDEATRRRALTLMRGAYDRLYGQAQAEAAAETVLTELAQMATRMASMPGGWHDNGDTSPAELTAAVLFLPLSDEERERLEAQIDTAGYNRRPVKRPTNIKYAPRR